MNTRFDIQTIALILAWLGTGCWVVCFWWMHRLSSRQEMMLRELHDVTKIKESVKDVAVAVSAEDASGNAARR
jgi:hypothetical protein